MSVIDFFKKQANKIYMDIIRVPKDARNAPYIASNGRVFLTETDCMNYERELAMGIDRLEGTGWLQVVSKE